MSFLENLVKQTISSQFEKFFTSQVQPRIAAVIFCSGIFETNMYIIFNIILIKSNRCLVKIRCRPSAKQIIPVIGLSCCQLLWPQGGMVCFLLGILNKVEEGFSAYFHPLVHQKGENNFIANRYLCIYQIQQFTLFERSAFMNWLSCISASALQKCMCLWTEPLVILVHSD